MRFCAASSTGLSRFWKRGSPGQAPGFAPFTSVDDLGSFARQRLEFVKRLYDMKHGIYRNPVAPIGGKVHVVGVDPDGVLRDYSKHRKQ
jgi:hypothetical protein